MSAIVVMILLIFSLKLIKNFNYIQQLFNNPQLFNQTLPIP